MKVLFVCSGNICRSPMAAACLRDRAAAHGLSHVVVESAGTLGIEGAPASSEAIAALGEAGIDLTGHRSRGLTPVDLRTADVIVGMTQGHLDELEARFPQVAAQRYLLRAFERSAEPDPLAPDLADPIGDPLAVYREQREIIRRCTEHLALHLKHMS